MRRKPVQKMTVPLRSVCIAVLAPHLSPLPATWGELMQPSPTGEIMPPSYAGKMTLTRSKRAMPVCWKRWVSLQCRHHRSRISNCLVTTVSRHVHRWDRVLEVFSIIIVVFLVFIEFLFPRKKMSLSWSAAVLTTVSSKSCNIGRGSGGVGCHFSGTCQNTAWRWCVLNCTCSC